MRWVVTGATGMLGTDVVAALRERGEDVAPLGRADLDVTDLAACRRAAAGADVVVNCAAHTAVDAAETEEAAAFAVNAVGARNLALAAAGAGARLVHVSTDYVFDGDATEPYAPDAPQAPRSAYGRTKAAGEWAVAASGTDALVLRTAWLYGEHGACFPKTMARVGAERGALSVVDDQVGQPTWTRDVARLALDLVAAGAPAGAYHAVSAGRCSWFGFAAAVLASAGLERVSLEPVTSAEFVRPAPRPAFSVLDTSNLAAVGVQPVGDWRERWEVAAAAVLG
ncbi:dTDP-4-dehydrorhamnose reductase [Paenibacillus sp. TRM 82003]|uniref:dTDP-4-dehydrorhamnose reductase n=1 Tax=Kineococcus sp. TRM81007 TaxID=2925831 RepID=UPI001F599BAE|nr:dTDP-4-dehydrorhamnose reductase [Kineococcus sp. TRM81007]MCI2239885.1 dTDP-4-dehydrorhamnose reductase [Kineococcus sp. TRM81007]MCI3925811.1 dTDP-4-dehydrorhamnose reductase [Paenibacillus sp. TRM 82003]